MQHLELENLEDLRSLAPYGFPATEHKMNSSYFLKGEDLSNIQPRTILSDGPGHIADVFANMSKSIYFFFQIS